MANGAIKVHHPFTDDVFEQFRAMEYPDPDTRSRVNTYSRAKIWEDRVMRIYQRCGTDCFTAHDIEDIGRGGGFIAGLLRRGFIRKHWRMKPEGIYIWSLSPLGLEIGRREAPEEGKT